MKFPYELNIVLVIENRLVNQTLKDVMKFSYELNIVLIIENRARIKH